MGTGMDMIAWGQPGVLFVDDDARNRMAAEAAFSRHHLGELVAVQSGAEALRHLLKRDFALVILDVRMPDMDGFETAELIRARDRNRYTPIIFLTAHQHDPHEVRRGYA